MPNRRVDDSDNTLPVLGDRLGAGTGSRVHHWRAHPKIFFECGVVASFPTAVLVESSVEFVTPATTGVREQRRILWTFRLCRTNFPTGRGAAKLRHGVTSLNGFRCHPPRERLWLGGVNFDGFTLLGVKIGVNNSIGRIGREDDPYNLVK